MKKTVQYLTYLFLSGMIAYSPVMRGLFFRPDYTRFFIAASVFFFLVLVDSHLRGVLLFRGDLADWAVLALAAVYGLSSLRPVSKMEAVDGALRYGAFLMVYVGARYVGSDRPARTLLAASVFVSAILASGVGLGAAVELIQFPGAYENLRIYGSLQYPNALAAYAMFASILGYYLWARCLREAPWVAPFAGLGTYLLTTVILCSQSRITWVIYPLFLLLFIFLTPAESRPRTVSVIGLAVLATGASSPWFLKALSQKQPRAALLYLVAGGAGVLLFESIRAYAVPRLQEAALRAERNVRGTRRAGTRTSDKTEPRLPLALRLRPEHLVACVAVLTGLVLVAVLSVPGWRSSLGELLPVQILRRFSSITLKDRSLLVRLFSLQDAFAIARDYPLLGAGAGGWNTLYHRYQRVLYYYTEAHSHFGQVAVETGFPGLVSYACIWVGALWAVYETAVRYRRARRDFLSSVPVLGAPRDSRGKDGERTRWMRSSLRSPLADAMDEVAAFGAAALSLGAHSSLDFELSLPAVMASLLVVLALLLGARDSGERAAAPTTRRTVKDRTGLEAGRAVSDRVPSWRHTAEIVFGAALACAVLLPSTSHLQGMKQGAAGVYYAVQFQDYEASRDALTAARRRDPWSSEYVLNLARLAYFQYAESGEDKYREEALARLEEARKLRPDDIEDVQVRAGILKELGAVDEAAAEYAHLVRLLPLSRDVYEAYASEAMEAALSHADQYVTTSSSAVSPEFRTQAEAHRKRVREYAAEVLKLRETMAFHKAAVTGVYAEYWNPRMMDPTPKMSLYLGQACYLVGDAEGALKYLSAALNDASARQEAAAWLVSLEAQTGKPLQVKLPVAPDPKVVSRVKPFWGLGAPE